jgi:hypothetical protein
VAEHFLGDEEAALELRDDGRRRLEDDDVIGAFAVPVDGIGQSTAAPGGDLDDLAAVGGDLAGGAIDDRGDLVVRRVRTEDNVARSRKVRRRSLAPTAVPAVRAPSPTGC